MKLLSLAIILTCGLISHVTPQLMTESDIAYLERFGYMEPCAEGEQHTDDEMKEGMRLFQSRNGMVETGTMTDEMHTMMNKSRCGLKDVNLDIPSVSSRAKRYVLVGSRWPTTSLKYKYNNYSPDLAQSETKTAIVNALKVWSDVTPLEFEEVSKASNADIDILFQGGNHGDGEDFDGPGGVLAHAYFPSPGIGGDAHFDEDELFSVNGNQGIDLFQVAAHEFGHSLGLAHSEDPNALMAPYYTGYIPGFQLPQDDINGIQALYGPKPDSPDPTPDNPGVPVPPTTNSPFVPDVCTSNFDAVIYDRTGVFIFHGSDVTRLEMRGTRMPAEPISSVFPELENNIDAAYYNFRERTYLIFKGDRYWEFNSNRVLNDGFPKTISQFANLPNDLDAVITWGSRYTYFFKGNEYWRYNQRRKSVDANYPQSIAVWSGVPSDLDAGFRWLDGELYFVKDQDYYFYDTSIYGVNGNVYPRSFGDDWLSCGLDTYIVSNSAHVHIYSVSALLLALTCVLYL